MNDGTGSTRISLRLADGEYFPIFRHGDPDTRNLSLVPATEEQDEADIQFFYHPPDGITPVRIGVVRFPDLPVDSGETELHLDAVIGTTGLLSVTVRHSDSGRLERLEMTIPDEVEGTVRSSSGRGRLKDVRLRWVLGILFVVAGLALVFWLTLRVTDWGRQELQPPPVSYSLTETAAV